MDLALGSTLLLHISSKRTEKSQVQRSAILLSWQRPERMLRTLPARVLDFRVTLFLSVNELGRSAVAAERWHGLSELR